ncbi:MAG: hypothetical protein EPN64_04470 [Burkholderiaceae bacterium]|nr:MAG: hypothetical protein EPN64_04470 [Burkholderiaceae bacterium]
MPASKKGAEPGTVLSLVSSNPGTTVDAPSIVVDVDLPAQSRALVISLATRASLHLADMHRSAAAFCITLYECREAHGRTGWDEFASRNFSTLSISNARNAVRAGKLLSEQIASVQGDEPQRERLARMSQLSRSALFVLANIDQDVSGEVISDIIDNPNKAPPTAAHIRQIALESKLTIAEHDERASALAAELADKSEQLAQLQLTLDSKESDRSQLEKQVAEQAQMIKAAGDTVVALRKEKADAERRARTPVEAIEYKLPPGVHDAAEALAKLKRDIAGESARRDKLVADIATSKRALESVQNSFKTHEESAGTLSSMKSAVGLLIQKYSPALIASMAQHTPTVKSALKDIATGLRAFADQISPAA